MSLYITGYIISPASHAIDAEDHYVHVNVDIYYNYCFFLRITSLVIITTRVSIIHLFKISICEKETTKPNIYVYSNSKNRRLRMFSFNKMSGQMCSCINRHNL